jgi:hypothetical protein
MRWVVGWASVLVVAAGCGQSAGAPPETVCPAIGTPVGISLIIPPESVAGISVANLEACWNGQCVTRKVDLQPATAPASTTCAGTACSAQMTSTGGLHGFADVPGLPQQPVRVTATFDDGKPHSVEVTPSSAPPGPPGCGSTGPQIQLVVAADHNLLARQR